MSNGNNNTISEEASVVNILQTFSLIPHTASEEMFFSLLFFFLLLLFCKFSLSVAMATNQIQPSGQN